MDKRLENAKEMLGIVGTSPNRWPPHIKSKLGVNAPIINFGVIGWTFILICMNYRSQLKGTYYLCIGIEHWNENQYWCRCYLDELVHWEGVNTTNHSIPRIDR